MNNFRFAFRNILKNKIHSLISIVGFSVASACLLLIFLLVSQEFNYNNFHPENDHIFRFNYTCKYDNGVIERTTLVERELSEIITAKVPQVEKCTAFRGAHMPSILFENKYFEENLCITEADFFDIFNFPVLHSLHQKLFQNPDEIVITKRLADKFKAIKSCDLNELLGMTITVPKAGNQTFVISAIVQDPPKNSSIQFDALVPYQYSENLPWSNNIFGKSSLFYKTDRIENNEIAEKLIGDVVTDYYQNVIKINQERKYLADTTNCFTPFSLPISEIYLSNIKSDYEKYSNKTGLYTLSSVGLLILIIACCNFMMLSIGITLKKLDELNVRIVVGAKAKNIISLLFTENFIIVTLAFALGMFLAFESLPLMNILIQKDIYLELVNIPLLSAFILFTIFTISLLTSALQLYKLNRIHKQYRSGRKTVQTRFGSIHLFITLQYILSIILIVIGTVIIKQTNYMKNMDLGFSSRNILNLRIYHLDQNEKRAIRDKLKSYPGIKSLTLTDRNYLSGRSSGFVANKKGDLVESRILNVDFDYVSTLNLDMIRGENFSPKHTDNQTVIINSRLADFLGIDKNPIGNTLSLYGQERSIVGIVEDFHFDSMRDQIAPLMLMLKSDCGRRSKFLFLKYHPEQLNQLIPFIEKVWQEVVPNKELDFKFWDEQLKDRYQDEERWSQIISYSALLAILLSSLGLFGLTLIIINRRIKEIGIRKVNGAKTKEILVMLNGEFVKWVMIAILIASPIAWYITNQWLQKFAYKTELSLWIFALAGVIALGIALLTVSWQSWRAARRNPVESLRYE